MQKKNWNYTTMEKEVEFKKEKDKANDKTLKK